MLDTLLNMIGYGIDLDKKESEEKQKEDKDDMYLWILRDMYKDIREVYKL